jgi:hypothetical protein
MTITRLVQCGRVECHVVDVKEDFPFASVVIDIEYDNGRPSRFIIDRRIEIDIEELNPLFELLKKLSMMKLYALVEFAKKIGVVKEA